MTKHKSETPDPEGGKQAAQARGGAPGEDRSKALTSDQSDGPFGSRDEGKAAGKKKPLREQK
jgi:hypothetical protein